MHFFLNRNYRNSTKLGLTLVFCTFLGSLNASTPVDRHSTNPFYSIDATYSNGSIKNENNEAVVGGCTLRASTTIIRRTYQQRLLVNSADLISQRRNRGG